MRHAFLFSIAPLLLVCGCANNNFSAVHVTKQLGDPDAVIDFQSEISIPEGAAASANVQCVAFDGDNLAGDVESANPSILNVQAVSGNPSEYVFLGVAAGSTHVLVLVNGVQVATVAAVVTPPGSDSMKEQPVDSGLTVGFDAGLDASDASDVSDASDASDAGAPDASLGPPDAGPSDASHDGTVDASSPGDAATHG